MPHPLAPYLKATPIIDWTHPDITALARTLVRPNDIPATARACFEWVRDNVRHSYDYQLNPVTCRASDVLAYRTGYCYAKSHLLAALLRANGIPAGFCYQRLSVNDDGAPYCLHGLNAVHLPQHGWYRVDARGNKPGVNAQFTPPTEQLAFTLHDLAEASFPAILSAPLLVVVEALQTHVTWDDLLRNLPDMTLAAAAAQGLGEVA